MSANGAATAPAAAAHAATGAVVLLASSEPAHRNFFDHYAEETAPTTATSSSNSSYSDALLRHIDSSLVGRSSCIDGPFGWRRQTYADYTASGKPLQFLEDYMQAQVLPSYANTHTTSSFGGLQTSLFRREARDLILRGVRGSKDDCVLFAGAGATAAAKLLLHVLDVAGRVARVKAEHGPEARGLVALLGPYEHHSNVLPWREAGAVVEWSQESAQGGVDLEHLDAACARLAAAHPHALKVGSFSAASNITGILTDSVAVTRILHKHGFLSVWDYAAAAPYVEVDMNPLNDPALAKDAVFFSPHKFLGGPGSAGVLVLKKKHAVNRSPSTPGGGTVFFVTDERHRYLENIEEREEGGTPNILASIRAGLVWRVREMVGIPNIAKLEEQTVADWMPRLQAVKNLVVVGNPSAARLPLFSLMFRFGPRPDTFLHSGFVATLLNDLFGIQVRAGCLCAGPYAQDILGIDATAQDEFERALIEKLELLRPGVVRLNVGWHVQRAESNFLFAAIEFVATHGWRFLPLYNFTVDSGEWKHRSRARKALVGRKWIAHWNWDEQQGKVSWEGKGVTKVEEKLENRPDEVVFAEYLSAAHSLLDSIRNGYAGFDVPNLGLDQASFLLPQKYAHLMWFALPSEALQWALEPAAAAKKQWQPCTAIQPKQYGADAAPIPATAAFSLLAPATSSQPATPAAPPLLPKKPVAAPKPAAVEPSTVESSPASDAAAADGGSAGMKRHAPLSKSQQKKQAKRQRQAEAAAANGEVKMAPATLSPSSAAAAKSDSKDEVCKNCWHVHWNSSSSGDRPSTQECTHCPCISFAPAQSARSVAKALSGVGSKIQKLIGKAIQDFSMIREGDKVAIGVSGGKDSLTLFHILRNLQRKSPVKFQLACVTVDPQTPEYDPSPLKAYFASQNVPYFYESQPILAMAHEKMDPKKQSICAFCSRMKRGVLYSALRREGYNVLALGQHLDDFAESLFMSIFHNGSLRTMKANYHAEDGDLRIIRPLLYVRERMAREYATLADLPIINENCPACFEAPKERQRVKLVLASQEHVHPNLFSNMLQAMRPLLGLENHKYKAGGSGDDGSADGDEEQLGGPASKVIDEQLLRVLRQQNQRTEEEEEDAAMDAACRSGACKPNPPRRQKGANKAAPNATASNASAAAQAPSSTSADAASDLASSSADAAASAQMDTAQ